MPAQAEIVRRETFAPILYVLRADDLEAAIALNNDLREAERFIAASDRGIANINIGPSGAEIGGAFGGRRKRAADGRQGRIRGGRTCGGRPTR